LAYKDPTRQRDAIREAQQRYRERQRRQSPVRSRAAEKYRKRRARFVRNTRKFNPNSAAKRNSLLILEAVERLPADDYYQAAATRLLEVVPRFKAVAQVHAWLKTTAKHLRIDDAANSPTTGVSIMVDRITGAQKTFDVAEALEKFGDFGYTPGIPWDNRDWGRSQSLVSWYPSHWYDPIQRKSWVRWTYRSKSPEKEVNR
jgi:hypothetical protein